MIDHKIEVLKYLATMFDNNHITWSLGASCMLYLRGITSTFDDLDIMIAKEDVPQVKELLSVYDLNERLPNKNYKTQIFLEYNIKNVEVDIMAGFIIVNKNKEYYFPLDKNAKRDKISIEGCEIFLDPIETWLTYYKLMNRVDKVKIIQEYIQFHE